MQDTLLINKLNRFNFSLLNMAYKKINFKKFTFILSLSLILSCVLIFVSTKAYKRSKGRQTIVKNAMVQPLITSDSLRDSIVSYGMDFLGTPYKTAGCSKNGFDCSGFVYFVFKHFEIDVPRSSAGYKKFGKEIPISKVKKGDVLVFLSPTKKVIGHVGIVTVPNGMESEFIHASSGNEMKVILTNLSNEGYTRRFVKAVDVLSNF